MSVDWVRRYCLSLPHTTEMVQWESDLLFKVAGKMYVGMALEPRAVWLSLKCTPEEFAELTELPGIVPAPYLARAFWIALENEDALPVGETKRLIRKSYDLVVAKLPKKTRVALGVGS